MTTTTTLLSRFGLTVAGLALAAAGVATQVGPATDASGASVASITASSSVDSHEWPIAPVSGSETVPTDPNGSHEWP